MTLRQQLVDDLVDQRVLVSSQWKQAFLNIRRDLFLGEFDFLPDGSPSQDATHYNITIDASSSALEAVYSDASLLTQYDVNDVATSSSSKPSMMATMLEHLDVHPGHNVLEVGTGTGYNAALLSWALGDSHVVTMDLDATLVEQARCALAQSEQFPQCVIGDGADGAPAYGPYDRILATCGFSRVPREWLSQLTSHGVVVVNLGLSLARLAMSNDGALSGPLTGLAAFMPRRTRLEEPTEMTARQLVSISRGTSTHEPRPARKLTGTTDSSFKALCGLVYPSIRQVHVLSDHNGQESTRWIDTNDSCWSRLRTTDDRNWGELSESGAHSPYDCIASLHTEWTEQGRPEITRYGIRVRPDGTHMLLLDENAVRVLL